MLIIGSFYDHSTTLLCFWGKMLISHENFLIIIIDVERVSIISVLNPSFSRFYITIFSLSHIRLYLTPVFCYCPNYFLRFFVNTNDPRKRIMLFAGRLSLNTSQNDFLIFRKNSQKPCRYP